MSLWRFTIEEGVGIILIALNEIVNEYPIYLLAFGIILIGIGIVDGGYILFKNWKIKKLSKFILIEPKTKDVEILDAFTPQKLRFIFRVINLSEKKLEPKSGIVSIYHNGQFITDLKYDSEIKIDSDGVFMWKVDTYTELDKREGYIWIQITIPKIETIYQWHMKCEFEYIIDNISISRKIPKKDVRFILTSQQKETILKKMK